MILSEKNNSWKFSWIPNKQTKNEKNYFSFLFFQISELSLSFECWPHLYDLLMSFSQDQGFQSFNSKSSWLHISPNKEKNVFFFQVKFLQIFPESNSIFFYRSFNQMSIDKLIQKVLKKKKFEFWVWLNALGPFKNFWKFLPLEKIRDDQFDPLGKTSKF